METAMRIRFRSKATSVIAALSLALAGAVLVPSAQAGTHAQAAPQPHSQSAQKKPQADLQGDLPGGKSVVGDTSFIHDPALVIADDGTWYVYSTPGSPDRGQIQIQSSHDGGTTWKYRGTVWDKVPAWIDEYFTDGNSAGLWAPEIYKHDGTYYMYYSASRAGSNNSLTALATNTTLDPADPDYEWVDKGLVVSSPATGLDPNNPGKTFNAIDAGIIEDADGKPYMSIGSFWYGIFLIPLEWPSGKPVENWQSQTVNIADRFMWGNPIEASYITKHEGYYYLFVSFDYCCRGGDSTYKVAVGRSESVKGPYLDKEGRDMFGGGGSVVLSSHGAIVGPGGQSVFGDYLAFHYYDASNKANPYYATLGIQKIKWVYGWPTFNRNVALPEVVTAPNAVTSADGKDASFTASATGTPSPVAVWETSPDGGATWQDVSTQPTTVLAEDGTMTSTLAFTKVTAAQDGLLVRATFHNAHGTATTEPVALTVKTKQGKSKGRS